MRLFNSPSDSYVRAGLSVILLVYAFFFATPALAQPVIVESDWSLLRSVTFNNPISAHYNPVDDYRVTSSYRFFLFIGPDTQAFCD